MAVMKKPRKTRREQRQDKLLDDLMACIPHGMPTSDIVEMVGVFMVGVIEVSNPDDPLHVWDELAPLWRRMIVDLIEHKANG